MIKYKWGTPLEDIARQMLMSIYTLCPEPAYYYTRDLYRAFIRANPNFWID